LQPVPLLQGACRPDPSCMAAALTRCRPPPPLVCAAAATTRPGRRMARCLRSLCWTRPLRVGGLGGLGGGSSHLSARTPGRWGVPVTRRPTAGACWPRARLFRSDRPLVGAGVTVDSLPPSCSARRRARVAGEDRLGRAPGHLQGPPDPGPAQHALTSACAARTARAPPPRTRDVPPMPRHPVAPPGALIGWSGVVCSRRLQAPRYQVLWASAGSPWWRLCFQRRSAPAGLQSPCMDGARGRAARSNRGLRPPA
jgi:hypothetical protein